MILPEAFRSVESNKRLHFFLSTKECQKDRIGFLPTLKLPIYAHYMPGHPPDRTFIDIRTILFQNLQSTSTFHYRTMPSCVSRWTIQVGTRVESRSALIVPDASPGGVIFGTREKTTGSALQLKKYRFIYIYKTHIINIKLHDREVLMYLKGSQTWLRVYKTFFFILNSSEHGI